MMNHLLAKLPSAAFAIILVALTTSAAFGSANIVIQNGDAAGVGFNDPTPVAPVGGNNGTTLGQQRLNAFQYAAGILGSTLNSGPTITVLATWENLTCDSSSGVLGSSGTQGIYRNFPGAPVSNTWYGSSLANALAGVDLDPANAEIRARFNVKIGTPGCLDSKQWYLGLDTNHGTNINLVTVLLHELSHGLGFQTFTNSSTTGAQMQGFPSVFDRFLYDNTTGKTWVQMNDAERLASAINTGNLVWVGPRATSDSAGLLTAGRDAQGRPQMYSPNPVLAGSSVSHWDKAASPNQVMEPSISSNLTHNLSPTQDLTSSLFADIGWFINAVEPSPTPTPTPIPTPTPTPTTPPVGNSVQFDSASFSVGEGAGRVDISVSRSGDISQTASVKYATSDTAGLTSCASLSGKSSERCDYQTAVGTLRFAAGEARKTFSMAIIDDAHVEGDESLTITLSRPNGVTLGSPLTQTLTIVDNDSNPSAQNPLDDPQFFITLQYIDFLGRLPDSGGLAGWTGTLNGCPNSGFGSDNPGCDRVHVSSGFFLSDEFRGRGYWAYRFYEVAFDRRPDYAEFVPDMAQVGGSQSPDSEALAKTGYTDEFVQRSEFTTRYNGLSNQQFVEALEQNAEIAPMNKQAWIDALTIGSKTRAQVLREIVESREVEDRFFIRAFVAMQYFGYLRRNPDSVGYNNWVNTLTSNPSDSRQMIYGFIYSEEYRTRFGR
jgi:Calx-beta domain-containing protein/uncharacterized protein DUF4214